jgi:predicted transcriptional regulator
MAVKHRLSVYLDVEMMARLEKLATKERAAKSAIAEAAIISFLTSDDTDRWEATVTRRLDRLARSVDRMERDLEFSVEALALYIRAWLTATSPLPDGAQAAAQAKGRERYESFVEALGRRLAKGQRLSREISEDVSTPPGEVSEE